MYKSSNSDGAQLDYQLTSIEAALIQIINESTAIQSTHSLQILPTIHRMATSIVLRGNPAHDCNVDLHPIEFSPFFPGSYTQPDVIVHSKNRDINGHNLWISPLCNFGPQRLPAQNNPGLSPLDPTLHFARFDPLGKSLNKILNDREKAIVIILSDSKKQSTKLDEQLVEQLVEQLGKNIGSCVNSRPLLLVSLANRTKNRKHSALQDAGRLQALQSTLKPLAPSVHSISIENTESLMALLCKSRVALVPTLAMAMDALNASCSFLLYGCEKNSLNEVLDLTAPLDQSAQPAQPAQRAVTIKAQREVQRRKLIAQQTEQQPTGLLIADMKEISSVFNCWISGNDSSEDIFRTAAFQPTNSSAIIPVNTACKSDIRARWATSRAKVRKLYQSPRQFMQDSQYTGLRLLGRLPR